MTIEKGCTLITPTNLNALLAAIQDVGKEFGPYLMYRGQRNAMWEMESSFSRSFTKDTLELMRNPATRDGEKSYYIAFQSFLTYFSSIRPEEEVIRKLNGQGCPYFEFARHHQQNFSNPKIHCFRNANSHRSPMIDFTYDARVALFFANFEIDYETGGLQPKLEESRSTDAAVYVVNYQPLEVYKTLAQILKDYTLSNIEDRGFKKPCIIFPSLQINDQNDPKPMRQQAVYVVQIDSRYSLDEAFSIISQPIEKRIYYKIIVKKELFEECKDFLFSRNYTLDYLFPTKLECRLARTQNVVQKVLEQKKK